MKKMLVGGVIAIVFAAIVADEIRLHQVVQRQSSEMEVLNREVVNLKRSVMDRDKQSSAARSVVLVPNTLNGTTNGSATIYGLMPGKAPRQNALPFASPFLQQQPSDVPPNWEPFEFNGRTYYRIPLANASPEPLGFRP